MRQPVILAFFGNIKAQKKVIWQIPRNQVDLFLFSAGVISCSKWSMWLWED